MEMPIYYLVCLQRYPYSSCEIHSCYLIKEGYITIRDYKENPNDLYYCAYTREQFCIVVPDKNIFTTLTDAIEFCYAFTKQSFFEDIDDLIYNRNKTFKYLESLEKT